MVKPLEQLPAELLEKLRGVSTATAFSLLMREGVRRTYVNGVRPLAPLGLDRRVVGRAVTLRFLPLREDVAEAYAKDSASRAAMESVEPGDVLVVDAMGSLETGTMGDILAARLRYRGVAAVVIDGCVRDSPFIKQMDLPVFAKGFHPGPSGYALLPVDRNVPVQCGGVLVLPGDVILADDEGVLVVPRTLAPKVAEVGLEKEDLELFIRRKVEQGASILEAYPPNAELMKEYQEQRGNR